MKRLLLSTLAALVLATTSNATPLHYDSTTKAEATTASAASESNQTKEGAKAAVEKIYNIYFKEENAFVENDEDVTEVADIVGFNEMTPYISEEFNQLYCMAQSKQNSTNDLCFDCDPWIASQDCQHLELLEVKITKFTPKRATAKVKFKNFGKTFKVSCIVIYDTTKKAWLIDDFIHYGKISIKKTAEDFLDDAYEE